MAQTSFNSIDVMKIMDQLWTSLNCTLLYSHDMSVLKKRLKRGTVVLECQNSLSPISPLALSVFVYN